LALNPLSALIEMFRHVVVPSRAVDWNAMGISAAVPGVFFIAGVVYFKSTEKAMADLV
jgi:ABC-type polysaccharide/polyol phosphate export permease